MNSIPAMTLTVIIPAYNEEGVILLTLRNCAEYLEKENYSYEIIVVDDGSSDKTSELVHTESVLNKQIKLISLDKNIGKGGAIKRGVQEALGSRILFMDADHSVSIDHLPAFMKALDEGCDIAIASIEIEGSSIEDVHHEIRRWAGRMSKLLIRILAVSGNFDTQRGFKLFTFKTAKSLFGQLEILRWGFDIEILVRAQKKNHSIREIPVNWHNDKKSAIGIADYLRTFGELISISLGSSFGKYD